MTGSPSGDATPPTAPPPATRGCPGAADAGLATAVEGDIPRSDAPMPTRLGPFQLLQPLGRGGMGVVYRARQLQPVDREVALKLLPGALDPAMLAYFEVERHSLARMQHPAIAQLYEAGTTADGRPWFAMELVPGIALDAYCASVRPSLAQRLRLLIRVCRAVQHAHDRGIVHRDLKPSNVLVQTVDGEAMPKPIDFGIASGMAARAERAGTDAYMSPEQLDDDAGVDVRNDVYAIGVMLCELLVDLPAAQVSARVRDLRSQLPAATLTSDAWALRRSGTVRIEADRPASAAGRAAPRPALSSAEALRQRLVELALPTSGAERLLRGELGHLLARSISPRRQERYASAGALAEDLQRLLDGAPISAHPPTRRYLAGKFVARHRLVIGAAGAVLAGLVLSLVVALHALAEARAQRDLARAAEAEAARQARIAASVNVFLVDDLLGAANLDERPNADRLTLVEVVEAAANGLRDDGSLEPEAEADIRVALGRALASLGRFQPAAASFERAARLRRDALGAEAPATLMAEAEAAAMRIDLSEHDEARERLQALLRRATPLKASAPALLDELRIRLARNAIFTGDYPEAEVLLQQVLAGAAGNRQRTEARRLQAWQLSRTGRHAQALQALRALSEDSRRQFGAESWPTLMADGALATSLHRAEDYEGARDLRLRVVETLRERFSGHSELGVQLSHLAAHRVQLQEAGAAEAAAREAIERMTRQLGAGHRMLGNAHSHLGAALLLQGRLAEAGPILLEARRIFAAALPEGHALIEQNEARISAWQVAARGAGQ